MKNTTDARKRGQTDTFVTARTLILAGVALTLALGISSLALDTRAAASQEIGIRPTLEGNAAVEFLKTNSEYESLISAFRASTDEDSNSPSAITRLTAADATAGSGFGISVAMSGDTVIIGANNDRPSPPSLAPGAAYIFVRDGTGWTQQQKLTPPVTNCTCNFGYSVGISGDTVIVGSLGLPTFGLAFVYVRTGTTWSLQQTLSPPSGNSNQPEFGMSVAISGETVVVGARTESTAGTRSGAAYIFLRNGTNWNLQQRIVPSDLVANTQFGNSVAINGEQAIIGAFCDSPGGVSGCRPGAAYVFVRDGTSWTEQQKLLASDGANNDQFGSSVAISGNTALIGAWQDDIGANANQGSAYVFTRNLTTWTEDQKLTAPDGAADDWFGIGVGLDGGVFGVSAFRDDIGANVNQGSAYIFNRCAPPGTAPVKLLATMPAAQDQFGYGFALSSDTVVVGANLGRAAYLFPRSEIAFRGGAQCESEIVVNTTGDEEDFDLEDDRCDVDMNQSGNQCTLRAAIQTANDLAGPDTITFDIPGGGTHTIAPVSALPAIIGPVSINATTQPGYTNAPVIELAGNLTDPGLGFGPGSSNSSVKGLAINRFLVGIALQNSNTKIESCYFGLKPDGSAAGTVEQQQIGIDIRLATATNNTIGGAGNLGNVISNNVIGVLIYGGAAGNKVFGNKIGTNAAGTSSIENTVGIRIEGASGNFIGDTPSQVGNLISGNDQFGINLNTDASANRLAFNSIGTQTNGTEILPNGEAGIFVQNGASGNFIDANVIGGHNLTESGAGIGFANNAGASNSVTGNFIGVARNGTSAIPNKHGIAITADGQLIGSETGGNTIGFNVEAGIFITSIANGSNSIIEDNVVDHNFVGTNGTDDIGNAGYGIRINGEASENTIRRNIVSGNGTFGIAVTDGPTENLIEENFVGTNASGTAAISNGGGIWIRQASNNTIETNLVSGNSIGMLIGTNIGFGGTQPFIENYRPIENQGSTFTSGNKIFGNTVGLNAARNAPIPGSIGIAVGENARDNQIGTATGVYNLISGNTETLGYGVFLGTLASNPTESSMPQSNLFQKNIIGLAGNLQTTIGNKVGFVLLQAVSNTIGGSSSELGNIIVGSTTDGVQITDGSRLNTIQNNRIGVLPGTSLRSSVAARPLTGSGPGNGREGVKVAGINATGNQLIDNFVANSGSNGILVGSGAVGTTIRGTSAQQSKSLIADNGGNGVEIESVSDITVLSTIITRNIDAGVFAEIAERIKIGDENQGNQIADNGGDGIRAQQVNELRVIANKLGMIQDELLILAGNKNGVNLIGATNTQIGDVGEAKTNIVVLSLQYAMLLDQVSELVKLQNNLCGTAIRSMGNRSGRRNRSEGQNLGNLLGGIRFSNGSRRNLVGGPLAGTGNVIANNGGPGVWIDETAGTGNLVDPNSIYGNAGPGIALGDAGHTPNDPADADTGPNNYQNYPTMTLSISGGNLIVSYQVDSAPANSSYGSSGIYVEFFEADATGAGRDFLGSDHYLLSDYTNGTPGMRVKNLGNAVALGITAGDLLTATATDAEGNSSEFTPAVNAPGGAPGFEGDVAPRPNGDGNMLSTDITQIRRFVSGLDTPNPATNEAQRIDCAPRSTFGDGIINSSDVVQGRRYVSGLDALTPAGGPASGGGSMPESIFIPNRESGFDLSQREMSIGEPEFRRSTVIVPIEMASQGNEVAMSFTLEYDPEIFSDPRITLGKFAPAGSTLTVNATEPGRIGILIDSTDAMPASGVPLTIATVSFGVNGEASGEAPIYLTGSIAAKGISDVFGNSLSTTYLGGVLRFDAKME